MSRLVTTTAALAVGGLLLTACGAAGNPEAAEAGLIAEQQRTSEMRIAEAEADVAANYAALPQRPSGVVEIDGLTRTDRVTQTLTREYDGTDGTQMIVRESTEEEAFARLCRGAIDLVASGSPIREEEWAHCRDSGLDVIQFQVAADAVVVAIKAETDVGGDCLTTAQVRDMFRAGSPVTSWRDVGMGAVPLHVGGPTRDLATFALFSDLLLGATQPSYSNLRSDYQAFKTDRRTRTFVVGTRRDHKAALRYPFVARRVAELRQARADARMVLDAARREEETARAEREKGIRDQRPLEQQQADQARLDKAVTDLAAATTAWRAAARRAAAAGERLALARERRSRDQRTLGRVAYYRHSYYSMFEDQLRPFEITTTDGDRNCVFASPWTISSGKYPLSRQFLLTTTSRSLDRDEVRRYLDYLMSHVQERATQEQLVPLPDSIITQQLRWTSGDYQPAVVVPASQAARQPTQTDPSAPSKPVR